MLDDDIFSCGVALRTQALAEGLDGLYYVTLLGPGFSVTPAGG